MRHIKSLPKKIMAQASHRFTPPSALVGKIGIASGASVLELGNPVGFIAPACLNVVGETGRVYVAGPTAESLEKLTHLNRFPNFHTVLLADVLVGRAVPKKEIDIILLTNLLSNSAHPDHFCLSIGQYLKPGGQIVLIDWDVQAASVGPAMERRVSKEEAIRLMRDCGMEFAHVLKSPGYHYGLVFNFKAK